ncbi:MAG TPA: TRAP transporter substrate-binding protein DctP [Solirubrobacteraceae bacterium]|nr:TRAP transporter substrate-binding protein DctP [Solirubrobacteraceae bacterium]
MARKGLHARRTALALITGLALAAAGCAGGDKAGGEGGTLTLRIGTEDTAGRPSGIAITEFARQVKEISGGRIRIEPVFGAGGKAAPGWDQRVARKVMAGELDMGLTPARAWDTEGVTSLRALHAPFLVDSTHLMDRVVTSDLAKDMLAGLDRAGVVGLALLPEDLRHPFGFERPLRTLEDFRGSGVRAPLSEVAFATLRSLGAEPRDLAGREFTTAVRDGSVAAMDSGFSLAVSMAPRPTVVAANVSLYPKVNSLVIDGDEWGRLTRAQRSVLRTAARGTLTRVLESSVPEAEAAQRFCARGGRVVLSRPDDLAAMVRSVQPVYAQLERDPGTKEQIARIRELKREPAPAEAAPAPCSPPPAAPAVVAEDPSRLNGVWRTEFGYDEALDAGIPPDVAAHEAGVQTIRMENGRYDWRWRSRQGPQRCPGSYRIEDRRVVFTDSGPCTGSWEATYELDGSKIRWSRVHTHEQGDPVDQTLRELIYGTAWRRIAAVKTSEPKFPAGVYRAEISPEFLVAHGIDSSTASTNSGLVTVTFRNGRWKQHDKTPTEEHDCPGTYAVRDGRVVVMPDDREACGSAAGGVLYDAHWTLRDGQLRFTDVRSGEGLDLFARVLWGGTSWRKIG